MGMVGFRKDNKTVIKIPSRIFSEVSNRKYLKNTKFAYQKILDYFPTKFVVKTTFANLKSLNLMKQTYVKGKNNEVISYNTKNFRLLKNIKIFLESALKMLDDYQWLPDFDIKRSSKGFKLQNTIIESSIPKIIDFTAYYDIYRLYPQRTSEEIKDKKSHIVDFLNWINKKIEYTFKTS